jgi:hypothetical protein
MPVPRTRFRARSGAPVAATLRTLAALVIVLLAVRSPAASAQGQAPTSLPALLRTTHVHGLAVEAAGARRLLIATHHGLYAANGDGAVQAVSRRRDDFMGFTPHPTDAAVLYASGHPAGGGNLGFIVSEDGGATWSRRAPGVGGPVDFHQLDISRADPRVVYGIYGALQVSRDAGRTWQRVGDPLEDTIDMAASPSDPETLYLATHRGLRVSRDGGRSWQPAHLRQNTATLMAATPDGTLYAFMIGAGLMRAREPALGWEALSNGFGEGALIHLAADPADPSRLYASTHRNALWHSRDGGRTWSVLAAP